MIKTLLDGAEALAALSRHGTVTEAARHLSLSQSAVSKRLHALEREVGHAVVVPDGRRVALTVEGQDLLDRARPLLSGLRDLGTRRVGPVAWTMGMDDSLAATWGPRCLAESLRGLKRLKLGVGTGPSILLAEQVRSGVQHLALGTDLESDGELLSETVVQEPWVLVHSGLERRPGDGPLLLGQVPHATTSEPELASRAVQSVATFVGALRLASEGFGDAIVPLGIAVEADLSRKAYRVLATGRTVSLLGRRSLAGVSAFVELRDALRQRAERHLRK